MTYVSFTRVSDSATLSPAPLVVQGPLEESRPVRNIARELLHSATAKVTFVPAENMSGTWKLLYGSHANAVTCKTFFAVASFYNYDDTDSSLDRRFMVHGRDMKINQTSDDLWELTIPWKEIP